MNDLQVLGKFSKFVEIIQWRLIYGCNESVSWEDITNDLKVSRLTATTYIDKIVSLGLLSKHKKGRANYYFNNALVELFVNSSEKTDTNNHNTIESIN